MDHRPFDPREGRPRRPLAGELLLFSLPLALAGQWTLRLPSGPLLGILLLASGAVALVAAMRLDASQAAATEPAPGQPERGDSPLLPISSRSRLLVAIASVVAAAVAFAALGGNRFTTLGTCAWAAAMLLLVAAFGERRSGAAAGKDGAADDARGGSAPTPPRLRWGLSERAWTGLALAAIVLLAAFFRFYRLDELPLDLWSDQAEKLLDIHDVLEGQRPIFFERNTGREPFQFYWTAALIWATPLEFGAYALKFGTALFGILSVPIVFALTRDLYGRGTALWSAALLAVSQWSFSITRLGLRMPFPPAFVPLTLFFLFRAFRNNRRNDWLACGFALGVGLNTYIPMRMVPLLLVILGAVKLICDLPAERRRRRGGGEADADTGRELRSSGRAAAPYVEATVFTRRFWINAGLGAVASLYVFLPLARYGYDKPWNFWERTTTRTGEIGLTTETLAVLARNVWNALLMFNWDSGPTHSLAFRPILDSVTASAFVLGIGYLLWRAASLRDRRAVYVLVSFGVMLLPSILALAFPDENPSPARTGGALPLVMMISALPLTLLSSRLSRPRRAIARVAPWPAAAAAIVLYVTIVVLNYRWYFVDFDSYLREGQWNTWEMGQRLHRFVEDGGSLAHAYHVPFPFWADTRLIGLHGGDITWENTVDDVGGLTGEADDPAAKFFLLHPDDREHLDCLHELFPTGRPTIEASVMGPTKNFVVFYVPPLREPSVGNHGD